jgi:hypothetical protein
MTVAYGAVTDHGAWTRYVPGTIPTRAPPNALFSQRDSDSVDWYDYVNAGSNFTPDTTVKMTVGPDNIVRAATIDPTRLFPGTGVRILEVDGAPLTDPQTDWGGQVYDPNTKTFSDPPPPIWNFPLNKQWEERIAALEAKLGGA